MSINGCRVMDILCQDTRLNISKYYMRPGNPFGGSCLPKDVKALKSFARTHNISVPILENTFESRSLSTRSPLEQGRGYREEGGRHLRDCVQSGVRMISGKVR